MHLLWDLVSGFRKSVHIGSGMWWMNGLNRAVLLKKVEFLSFVKPNVYVVFGVTIYRVFLCTCWSGWRG